MPSFKEGLVRCLIDRTACCQPRMLARSHCNCDSLGDRPRQLVLEGQDVLVVALIALRPQVPFSIHLDKLTGDPDALTGPEHCSFDDMRDSEPVSDVAKRAPW